MEGEGDAGEDPKHRSREVEVRRGQDDRDDIHGAVDTGPERIGTELDDAPEGELTEEERAAAEVPERKKRDDDEEKYEVVVDGHPQDVTLGEALSGYVRQETFHRRMNELSNLRAALEEDHQRQQQNWGLLMQAKEAYEVDVRTMMPTEPDWDREFAINPQAAHANQKIWQAMWAKLAQSQRERAWMAQQKQEAEDRRLEKYAVDGFSRFVFDSKIPDKAALEKEINSMRRTALSHGFSEQEVATVYDPRMLAILRKASKYDRMMAAAKPRAEVPGKGRTLTPGCGYTLRECGSKRTRRSKSPVGEQRQDGRRRRSVPTHPLTGVSCLKSQTLSRRTTRSGNREDLSNVIYNIDPFDTPVMSAIRGGQSKIGSSIGRPNICRRVALRRSRNGRD